MIAVVNCGTGNVGSVLNMLKKLGLSAVLASKPEQVLAADRLILPGVGAFDTGIARLRQSGLLPAIEEKVRRRAAPVLGICLGLQILTRGSEEGHAPGLGWVDGETVRFRTQDLSLKVPHMGWNTIKVCGSNPLLAVGNDPPRFYFVHSYHLRCDSPGNVVAIAHHGYDFPAVVVRDNVAGTQFHPEKSHRFGMDLLRRFALWS